MTKDKVKGIIENGILILMCFCGLVEVNRLGLSTKRTLAIAVVCFGSILIHWHRAKNKEGYFKAVLGLKLKEDRDYRYDWLRVLAVVMVIVTHAVQVDLSLGLVSGEKSTFILNVIYMLCLACNLIYVMLSGALLIPYREERLMDFYVKRIVKVFLPMAVYFVFYLWQNLELETINFETIKGLTIRLIQGETPESPHYWLMYTLLSVYIVIPLFRYMFRNMPYEVLTTVVVISIVLMGVNLFSPIRFQLSSFIFGWEGIAIIGYWVTRPETKKYYYGLMALGGIAFVVMVIMIVKQMDYRTLCCNTSPIMTLISTGIFAFVFLNGKFFQKGRITLSVLSKYSYSLILIHWWTLHWITRGRLNIQVMQYNGGGLLLSLLITLIVSLFAAMLIDNYIIVFFEQLIEWIIKGIKYVCIKCKNILLIR